MFLLLQSKQYSAGFAGSAEGVPDNSGNLQMWSRVSVKAWTGLQLWPQGTSNKKFDAAIKLLATFLQGS